MMSIGKLVAGPGVGRYYIDQVAQGREDYYAGEGEAAGVWMGTGVALLGLSGEVGEQELARLLEGRDPCSGLLLRPLRSSSPVAGFDLTLRAPKSVSILFGVAEREVAQRVVCAHELAVAEAIGYLEREACWTRRGAGGVIRLPGRGFVAAGFRHRSSRAGDPLSIAGKLGGQLQAKKVLPSAARRWRSGAGSHRAPNSLWKRSIVASTLSSPTMSAWNMGPPRQAGKP